jgi:AGZA family xanthine/uracil permease-like MFS transporter
MFRTVKELRLETLEDLIPPYLTIVLIPLTFSITQGLLWGFLSQVLLYTLAGRAKEVSPTLVGLAALSAVMLSLEGR